MGLLLSHHEILETLREGADRIVMRTRYRGEACVTRVILRPVPLPLRGLIEGVVTSGMGSLAGLDEEVIATLEGYRVRCRLGSVEGLPDVRAAGLAEDPQRCPPQTGLPFVTTRWIPGVTLNAIAAPAERALALSGLLRILQHLHDHNVVYGDLKPHNVVVNRAASPEIHLIDLDTLREVPGPGVPIQVTHRTLRYAAPEQEGTPPLCYPASDIFTVGLMVCELLGGVRRGEPGFPPPLPPRWQEVADACFRQRPLDRPHALALRQFLSGQRPDLPTWSGASLHAGTEPVYTTPVRAREVPPPLPAAPVLNTATRTISLDSTSAPTRTTPVPPSSLPPLLPIAPIREAADIPPPMPPPPTDPPARPRRTLSLVMALSAGMILVGIAALGIVALAIVNQQARLQQARQEGDRLLAALQDHKTIAQKNDLETLQQIYTETTAALALAQTPELLGLSALETVWLQKWQYSSTRWSPARFAEGEAVVNAALAAGETPAARLAQGILLGGACWRMTADEPTLRRERCEASLRAFEGADRLIKRREELRWMQVEAHWAAVMTAKYLAEIHDGRGDTASARSTREAALRRCQEGTTILDAAPVNGRELLEDCLAVAGPLQQYPLYLEWADWLLNNPASSSRNALKGLQQLIFLSLDPACATLGFNKDNTPRPPDANQRGNTLDLCRYMGFVALGCPQKAEESRVCTQSRYLPFVGEYTCAAYMEVEGVPWDAAEQAARSPRRSACPWN